MRQNDGTTKVIGITGGIGCGKSTAVSYLENRYHAIALRADEISRAQLRSGGVCFDPVREIFGDEVLTPDGELNRAAIAKKAFADRELLERLNAVTHPAVHEEVKARVEEARQAGGRLVCIEAALLLEENYDEICDEVWYVFCDEEIRRDRLRRSRGYSDEKIDAIMKNQLSEEEFRARCQVVIDNNGDVETLRMQIDALMERRP